jgi:Zn-dependent membrane protease YugP
MYFYDPLYLLVMGASLVLGLAAQAWVTTAVRAQASVPLRSGMSGADVAGIVLRASGLSGVRIEPSHGFLSDHYDPTTRTLRLSEDNYWGRSVAAAGIAAHEAGHAIQDARGFWPMRVRQKLVPVANIGTQLGVFVFAGFVAFTLVTLPVEIDASRRAYGALAQTGMFAPQELSGVGRVLRAAAATYVAATITAILQLLYFALRVFGGQRRED